MLWLWGLIPLSRGHWVGGVACHLAFSFAIMAGYYLVRIHRSTIINIDRVRKLSPSFVGECAVVLHDRTKLKLCRGYHDRLAKLLKQAL